uniref:DEAD/DEAH box helicase n=1 Tax=Megaviridae environmental sample TaxID=1737588 RepID=A0A5J6VMB1_9VIRU|nr:MAG: DEAD/DEAH box helicase [Megaviridae environmental sample]
MVIQNKEIIQHDIDLSMYEFTLSPWQQNAIWGIINNKHVIVSAPTGSGKTLPAEYAIHYFSKQNKKIIYTTPIKALSNQKKFDFMEKFPEISTGILTGDIKDNPEADVILMTTEILNNYFDHTNVHDDFNINIETDVGLVIYDEAHYINDDSRGHIWEECFIKQPKHIPMLLMSATISNLNELSTWIEETTSREVVLSMTDHRIVPLEHYFWYNITDSAIKKIKDKPLLKLVDKYTNKPILIKDSQTDYKVAHHDNLQKIVNKTRSIHTTPYYVLNNIVNYIHSQKLTPAICFVYSRDKVEQYAHFIETNLHLDSKHTQIIEKECLAILRKLPNYKEYIILEEYTNLIKLLQKGIAIHHSGMIPIFKELVELMFSKNYVQLLFATETFSVGLNMPTKTVIFTSLYKFDGNYKRLLYNHEYTQQAGRAGRRGFDTKGMVFHLNNLFDFPSNLEYKSLLINKPPNVSSKFKLSYDLIFNQQSQLSFKTLMQRELTNQIQLYEQQIKNLQNQLKEIDADLINKPTYHILNDYHDAYISFDYTHKHKDKERLDTYKNKYNSIEKDYHLYVKYINADEKIKELTYSIGENSNYMNYNINTIQTILIEHNFIDMEGELLPKGVIAKTLKEVHYLSMAAFTIETNYFEDYTPIQLIGLFSLFSNIRLQHEEVYIEDIVLLNAFTKIEDMIDDYRKQESIDNLYTGIETTIQKTIPYYTMMWANAQNEKECLKCINLLYNYENVYTGDFIKTILKVVNVCKEYEMICNQLDKFDLLQKIKQIYPLLLKYFVTNRSLYL